MNRMLTTAEVDALAHPIPLPPPRMTKREKLTRLAEIIRAGHQPGKWAAIRGYIGLSTSLFVIFHNLEHLSDEQLAQTGHPASAFNAAGDDPVLQKEGLKKDYGYDLAGVGPMVSALEAKRFFELTKDELHAFSCDCGGAINDATMAARVESIAARS